MNWINKAWDYIRTSLWFLPSLMVLGSILLALGLIALDKFTGDALQRKWPLLLGAGAEGSRGVLSAIASSMITVAGVTFSITIVSLSLAASQYSPRVLRSFMRDRGNQTVLGVFLAVFAYCLVVLRVIRNQANNDSGFLPAISVLVGVLLALVAIGFLIYFIHHMAGSIQAVTIIESAARETRRAVDRLFPAGVGEPAEDRDESYEPPSGAQWHPIEAEETGYIQFVEPDRLLKIAGQQDAVIRMERGIGEWIVAGGTLVAIAARQEPDEALIREVNRAFALGLQRTVEQDPSFGIQQIVDMAIKALSPGINDTTTAVICLDHLAAVLARIASRSGETKYRRQGGKLRLISRGPTFATLLGEAFDQIRRNASGNVPVLLKLLESVKTVSHFTPLRSRRELLRQQVELVWEAAQRTLPSTYDRNLVRQPYEELVRALGRPESGHPTSHEARIAGR